MAEAPSTNTNLRLSGKIAIVTGGASGIGEATVRVFANEGVRVVVIADIQDELVSISNQRCIYVHCDVADEDQVQNLIESTVNTYGQVDIMFSNAGIISPTSQTLMELDMSQLDQLFSVNVRGMALCVKHAARAMVEGHVRGSIVCTGSVSSSQGGATSTDYTMSKHAVLGLMRAASVQLATHGIRVNSVSPNGLATPLSWLMVDLPMANSDLCKKGGLRATWWSSVEEQVAKSIYILTHNAKNGEVSFWFRHSGETISRLLHQVLKAILELEEKFIVQPDGSTIPLDISSSTRFYPYFKDCVGAIDGTHIRVKVSTKDAPRYRWEGYASDSRIIKNALTHENKLKIPQGKYYLVDAGFMLTNGLITPYRGVRYHMKEYSARNPPQNSKEFFNLRHASLRNAIERAFGVLLPLGWVE
ncbi:(-)-isopiperitenol/(-)-carveol dehydrogenase, mitochondrial [Trifolium repens]|nr:(-)-isopiperitenol/(-)-carveol dehydrogenase, mitochondrial [Trifolium repens]